MLRILLGWLGCLSLLATSPAAAQAPAPGAPPDSVYGLLKRTAEAGSREILTVAAQEEYVNPSARFPVEAV